MRAMVRNIQVGVGMIELTLATLVIQILQLLAALVLLRKG